MKKFTLLFLFMLAFGFIYAQHTIDVVLKTDNYGTETTWEVVNTVNSAVLAEGGPYTDASVLQTIAPIDVDGTGCYAFIIYDQYGDGICCSYGTGYFEVYYDEVLIGEGGEFAAEASVQGMGDGCPQDEIELVDITMSPYGVPSTNINVTGTVMSNGVSLTSFTVTYQVDGGGYVADFDVTCSIGMGETVDFTHNIPVNFPLDGTYQIEVFVSNPNGIADDETDNTMTHNVIVNSNTVPRKVLLEQFTTGQCPNCPPATTNLETWTSTRPDVIWISQHAGYYTDPMTIAENTELLVFFNDGGSTYAPATMLDRAFLSPDGDPGPVFFPSSTYTPALMDERLETPAFATVVMEGVYNPDTRVLDLTVSGELVGDVAGEDLRMSVYIVEDGIVGTQSGVTGSYTHHHVMRDAISATFGDASVITSNTQGTTYTKTYSYTHNAAWVPANLTIVAFINNYDANVNNREVLNAESMPINDFLVNANSVNANNFMVFPNPANDVLNINFAQGANIQIVNNLGQVVMNIDNALESNRIDVSAFEAGSYFVKITKDNVVTNHKVILVK